MKTNFEKLNEFNELINQQWAEYIKEKYDGIDCVVGCSIVEGEEIVEQIKNLAMVLEEDFKQFVVINKNPQLHE